MDRPFEIPRDWTIKTNWYNLESENAFFDSKNVFDNAQYYRSLLLENFRIEPVELFGGDDGNRTRV